jgi:hypothetical protein
MNRHALAGVDALERAPRGLGASPEQCQTMRFGNDQIGGDQSDAALQCLTEETVGLAWCWSRRCAARSRRRYRRTVARERRRRVPYGAGDSATNVSFR